MVIFTQCNVENFLECLMIIHRNAMDVLHIIDEDFILWCCEELEYLQGCAQELDSMTLAVKYIEILQKLQFVEETYVSVTQVPFLIYTPAQFLPGGRLSSSAQQGTTAINAELNEVVNFEQKHNITECWTADHPEYTKALEHISKAITCCLAAICAAIAPQQCPSWPKLDYTNVIRYLTLGEFELLKYSHYSILEKPWTTPSNQEMLMKFFQLLQLQEEIECLNVEILQLQAWVDFNDEKLQLTTSTFKANNEDNMAAELYEQHLYWHQVNNIHHSHLSKIYKLTGYTGTVPICMDDQLDSPDHEEETEEEASDEILRLSDTLKHMQ
ncbi:hypothetical protein V8B97DRAFT_2020775 [Scleroderma yunnanense]